MNTDPKRPRGFAAMSPESLRRISSMGGQAARDQGVGHRWSREEACVAARLGAVASCAAREPNTEDMPSAVQPVDATALVYDRIAGEYAAAWFDDPVMEPLLDAFVHALPSPGVVLDVGCGPGRDVRALLLRGIQAIGVDRSIAMIREAMSRCPAGEFRQMDMRALAFPSAHFSGVWACASLQHLPREGAEQALSEIARVLKPRGSLAVVVKAGTGSSFDRLGRFVQLYEVAELSALLEDVGFVVVQERRAVNFKETLGPGHLKQWIHCLATKRP